MAALLFWIFMLTPNICLWVLIIHATLSEIIYCQTWICICLQNKQTVKRQCSFEHLKADAIVRPKCHKCENINLNAAYIFTYRNKNDSYKDTMSHTTPQGDSYVLVLENQVV